MGVFDWPLTEIGQTTPPVKCPYGPPGANAARHCGGNFGAGGEWNNPDASSCKYKSKRTNQLNNLAKVRHALYCGFTERISDPNIAVDYEVDYNDKLPRSHANV